MIDVRDLHFTYAGTSTPAVRGMRFAVQPGEIFGFLGPSGAGKSTTQKILTGLLGGYRGSVNVRGREISAWGADLYEHIGVSFELPNHYQKLTALENLNFFRSLYRGQTEEPQRLLEMVGLADDADKRVGQFSKGMQMRLNVARALINRPELLFLDEPTSGMDPVNARAIKAIIQDQQRAGRTVFLTTHNMAVAEDLCDRVAFVVDGTITLIDSPRQLKLRYGDRHVRVEFRANSHVDRREFPLTGLLDNQEFVALMRRDQVETIHTQEATLEDIFIHVTGRRLV